MDKISVHEEIYNRINSEIDCYSSAQIIFYSRSLSARKNRSQKIRRIHSGILW